MNTKHTPGPWRLSTSNPLAVNTSSAEMAIGIATTHGTDDSNYSSFFPSLEQAEANARLIAAAPELLDALQSLLARVSSDIIANQCWHEEQRAARAAIAKATNP